MVEIDSNELLALANDLDAQKLGSRAAAVYTLRELAAAAPVLSPDGAANLRAIMADQGGSLNVGEIAAILDNQGGFMPDEAVAWFREVRSERAPSPSDDVRSALADAFDEADYAVLYRIIPESGTTTSQEIFNASTEACELVVAALRTAPVSAPVHQGALDTINNLFGLDDRATAEIMHGRDSAVGVTREAIAQTLDRVAKDKSNIYLSSVCTFAMADAILALSPAPDATVSDERALALAERIRAQDLSVEDAAAEIMQYATDGAMQLQREGYFTSPQDVGRDATVSIREAVRIAESFKYDEETKACTNGARTYGNDEACDKIATAFRSLASGANP